jgi:hypothetical protein
MHRRAEQVDALDAAVGCGDPAMRVLAIHGLLRPLMESGRIDAIADLRDDFALAARQSQYAFAWFRTRLLDNAVDLARGDLDGIEQRIFDTLALGQRMAVVSAPDTSALQLAVCWMEQRRHSQLIAVIDAQPATATTASWHALRCWLLAQSGERAAATRDARKLVSARPWESATEIVRPFLLGFLGELVWELELADIAQEIAPAFVPYRGRFLNAGYASVTCGPIERGEGLALLAAGEVDGAVSALTAAHELARAGGAWLWADRSALAMATALAARRARHDSGQAAALVRDVEQGPRVAQSPRLAHELAQTCGQLREGATAPRLSLGL